MKIEGLHMYPYSTSLMGVVKGVLDYYGVVASDARAFGGTGHAFFVNISEVLCPSAPYCWNISSFRKALVNFGVDMQELGFFPPGSSAGQRSAVEEAVRGNLDRGIPCSVCNTDHQIVAGYDEKGLVGLSPWPETCPDYPPGRLSYGSWEEFGGDVHASFFAFPRCESHFDRIVPEGLSIGLDMYANPSKYSEGPYRSGPGAFDRWIGAIEKGHGHSHGNWWCGMVWSECRRMASSWMSEIACSLEPEKASSALELARIYSAVSVDLHRAGSKSIDQELQVQLLKGFEEEAASILKYLV
jgi:hypothetical protein